MLYRHEPCLPLDYMFGGKIEETSKNLDIYVKQLQNMLSETQTIATKNIQVAQATQKVQYDTTGSHFIHPSNSHYYRNQT